jgi:hypothetical protein
MSAPYCFSIAHIVYSTVTKGLNCLYAALLPSPCIHTLDSNFVCLRQIQALCDNARGLSKCQMYSTVIILIFDYSIDKRLTNCLWNDCSLVKNRKAFCRMIVLEVNICYLDTVHLPVAQDFLKRLQYSIEVTEL